MPDYANAAVKQLTLRNFRNYASTSLTFGPGVTEFYGDNAQGKTNILEALYFLSLGRSFRTNRLQDLIHHEADTMALEMTFVSNDVEQTLQIVSNGKEKRVMHNHTLYPSLSSLMGLLPVVLLAPDDELIKGAPQIRRHFLDLQISQEKPGYIRSLHRYQKAMRQRNRLLRGSDTDTIEIWEEEMAQAAATITRMRLDVTTRIAPYFESLYPSLSGENCHVSLKYQCRLPDDVEGASWFREQFRKDREREKQLGITLAGPHRDDLFIYLEQKECRFFASEGQKETCLTALRCATWHLLKEKLGFSPLLLIDDWGGRLDQHRRKHLLHYLKNFGQVFLTNVERSCHPDRTVYHIRKGEAESCG